MNPDVVCVIGNGVVIHLPGLLNEMEGLRQRGIDFTGRLLISDRAHIVFDMHQGMDALNERSLGSSRIGTTNKGIGPAYGSKTMRNGLRMCDLQNFEYFKTRFNQLADQVRSSYPGLLVDDLEYYNKIKDELIPMIVDSVVYCSNALKTGKNILVEGANATSKSSGFFS